MKKILIVDDNKELLDINASILRRYFKVEVISFSDSEAAARLAESKEVSLIITDFRMPRVNGLDLVKRARKLAANKGVPAIIISGYVSQVKGSPEDLARVKMIDKPANRWKLIAEVESILYGQDSSELVVPTSLVG